MTRHNGRRALVTGAGAGLGQAYAKRLAADGAELILADIQSPDATAEMIRAAGGVAHTLVVDVSSEESTAAMGKAVADLGGADILVNMPASIPVRLSTSSAFRNGGR